MLTGLLIENAITGGPLRILNYSKEQYLIGFGNGVLNVGVLFFKIIAYQNERSGFITLLGYIGLIYAFLGDIFIFDETFETMELIGIITILLINLALVF